MVLWLTRIDQSQEPIVEPYRICSNMSSTQSSCSCTRDVEECKQKLSLIRTKIPGFKLKAPSSFLHNQSLKPGALSSWGQACYRPAGTRPVPRPYVGVVPRHHARRGVEAQQAQKKTRCQVESTVTLTCNMLSFSHSNFDEIPGGAFKPGSTVYSLHHRRRRRRRRPTIPPSCCAIAI